MMHNPYSMHASFETLELYFKQSELIANNLIVNELCVYINIIPDFTKFTTELQ